MAALGPVRGIPSNIAKEHLSGALIRGLCAQAGLNTSEWSFDDGIDLMVGSINPVFPGIEVQNIKIHVQMKSTD
ncbi:MAG TPA: hypothetical protein VH475_15070, partial [Tepidisphaeraceae bacterium]